jgi:hypothetical protein
MTFDGTCERGGVQRAPQEIEERSPDASRQLQLAGARGGPVVLGGGAVPVPGTSTSTSAATRGRGRFWA